MDIQELKEQLKAMGVPERYYAINGDLGSDKYILNYLALAKDPTSDREEDQ